MCLIVSHKSQRIVLVKILNRKVYLGGMLVARSCSFSSSFRCDLMSSRVSSAVDFASPMQFFAMHEYLPVNYIH